MTNISLTQRNLQEILDAFEHFFPSGETIYVLDKPFKSLFGEYNWKNRSDFTDFVRRLTGVVIKDEHDIEHIKKAEMEISKLVSSSEEEQVEANTPDKWTRESQEAERQTREKLIKESQESAKKKTEASIKNKQEIYKKVSERQKTIETIQNKISQQEKIINELEGKKIYAKVDLPTVEGPDKNTRDFIKEARTYPRSFRDDLSNNLRTKIENSELGKNLSQEEIRIIADKVANDTIEAINNPQRQADLVTQTAILKSIAANKNVIVGVSTNEAVLEFLKTAPNEIASFNNTQDISREILSSVNDNLSVSVFGPDPEMSKVYFFTQPIPEVTHQIDLGDLNSHYIQSLQSQSHFFYQMESFGKQEAKNFLFRHARSFLDSQIAKLPADSVLSGMYNSAFGQQILEFVGLSKNNPLESSLVNSIIGKIPGISKIFTTLGEKTITPVLETGIQTLEVVNAAGQGAKLSLNVAIGNAVAKGAAWLLAKVGLKAAASKVLAAIGSGIIPVIGTIVGAVVGELFGKLIEKLWPHIKKLAPWILGLVAGGGALLFVGPTAAVVIGAGVGSFAAITSGTLTIGLFISIITAPILIPFLITILTTPIIIALILLIINSGAYIVPSVVNSGYGVHDCSMGAKIVERAEAININLQHGFNNYYNKSPDYPELWNAELYAKNPNPPIQTSVIGATDMFWCNYTPIKSYLAIREYIPFGLTAMMNYFISEGKWTSGETATTDQICPGDTIFFRSPSNSYYLSHVAVVYSVTEDEIITVQSNSPWKKMNYFTDSSGHFPVYTSGGSTIKIVGFGAP